MDLGTPCSFCRIWKGDLSVIAPKSKYERTYYPKTLAISKVLEDSDPTNYRDDAGDLMLLNEDSETSRCEDCWSYVPVAFSHGVYVLKAWHFMPW
jgi:hypothetical protein